MKNPGINFLVRSAMFALLLVWGSPIMAQHIRGALEGAVADQNGAAISGAKVSVKNDATNVEVRVTANDRGFFNVQNLEAGNYTVTVEQAGFRKYVAKDVTVKVGSVTPLNVALQVGAQEQVVEVTATATEATVDTSRSTVDGVVTAKTIESLPLNGRNFLDLAQLEPGVQVRDGGDFDPTKNQMAGVSIGGRSGRSTRIQVDGVDITDETVGTTTANLSNETIQEFQVSRSTLDASTDLTSSGAVNIVTRSGGNAIHGSGFGFFRNQNLAADIRLTRPTNTDKPPFDRQQGGGRAGGYFIKDKWLWHAEYEQNNQDGQQVTSVQSFPQFSKAFGVPLDERLGGARTDYNIKQNLKAFYRYGYNYNFGVTGFGGIDLGAFANLNNTNTHVVGLDYNTSRWTHSARFSYLNFNNFIVDANAAAGTPTTLDPGGKPVLVNIQNLLTVGPDSLAPQQTFQDNKQTKYDASAVVRNHTFRFGASYNKIDEAVFASFFGLAPRIRAQRNNAASIAFANANGGDGNPLNYRLTQIVLGNGLGAFSERPALGFPNGGTINDRLGFYFSDAWKIKRNVTLNYALRYDYDSALSDSDLARTSLLAQFSPTLAGKPNNDTNNFAPQLGFAWDVNSDGKLVVRAGGGLFYDTNVINNFLFDRVLNLPPGLGNDTPVLTNGAPDLLNPATGACIFRANNFNTTPGQCAAPGGINLFQQPLKNVTGAAQLLQSTLQQVTGGLAANFPPPGVPPLFNQNLDAGGSIIFNKYKRPYGLMFNAGFQYELRPGLVVSADYLRNRGVHFNQTTDLNRLGAANTLNVPAARAAIAATNDDFGCGASASAASINCAIDAGATILDYAGFGLGGGSALDGNVFQGLNPNFRGMGFIQPIGLSTYNAFTVALRGRLGRYGLLKNITGNISYALSRFESSGLDQDFISASGFNDAPTKFFGPAGLDRTHQFTMGMLVEMPYGFKLNTVNRFTSSLAQSAFLPAVDGGPAEIFFTDLDGDGITSDPLPGTNRGSFGRSVKNGNELNNLITAFNQQVSSKAFTPAGQALVSAGLFTQGQLQSLGGVVGNGSAIKLAPTDQVSLDNFFNTDVRFSWTYKVKERMSIQPIMEVFNLFNIANYDTPNNRLGSSLNGQAGSINGTSPGKRNNRYGLGSGSFSPGIPRAFQLGIR